MNTRVASFRRRSISAAVWAGGGHAMSMVIRLAGNLVLARIMVPEAFGVMAVVLTVLMALSLLSDIGSGTVVVQSERGDEEPFLNTAWTLQLVRGAGIWLFAGLVGLGMAWGQQRGWFKTGTVYDDPQLPMLLFVASFSMVLQGATSINAKVAERQMQLRQLSLIELSTQVLSLLFMVVTAWLTRSIWALALGAIVAAAVKCVLTHWLLPGPRARFVFEREAVREMLGKGKWVLLSSLLGFVAMNGDRGLLGGMVDGTTLGLYSIAFGLATIAPSAMSAVLGKVIFPAFSEVVRERPQDLPRVYRKFQQLTDLCVGAVAALMVVASDAIIGLLYDARYQGAAPMFAALAIGSIGVRYLVVEQIYVAMGRTGLLAAAIAPRAAVMIAGVLAGFAMAGMPGALWAIVLSQFAHWPLALWFRAQHGLNNWRNDLYLPVGLIAGAAAGMVVVLALRQFHALVGS